MGAMDYKQVIVVRTDLGMSHGKMAVQVAHASHSAAERARDGWKDWYRSWMDEGQKKVVVKAAGEQELRALLVSSNREDMPVYLVSDAGLTELDPGTVTALGIGPAPNDVIDRVTGNLRLL